MRFNKFVVNPFVRVRDTPFLYRPGTSQYSPRVQIRVSHTLILNISIASSFRVAIRAAANILVASVSSIYQFHSLVSSVN